MEQLTEQQPTQVASNAAEPPFAAFVGIDWADKKHYWSLDTGNGRNERGTLDNTPEAVEAWMMDLHRRFAGKPLAVALEQRRGALVVMLGKYEHAYLYPGPSAHIIEIPRGLVPVGSEGRRQRRGQHPGDSDQTPATSAASGPGHDRDAAASV